MKQKHIKPLIWCVISLVLFATLILVTAKTNKESPLCANQANYQSGFFIKEGKSISPTIHLEIACSFEEKQKGLMFVESLDENSGMLFIFPETRHLSFWMKNTYIPLDIIFLNQHFNVVAIESLNASKVDYEFEQTDTHEAQFVLEVNKGYADKYGISVGDQFTFTSHLKEEAFR